MASELSGTGPGPLRSSSSKASSEARTSQRWRLEQVETRIEAQLAALRHTRRLIREALAACDGGHCQLVAAPSSDAEA